MTPTSAGPVLGTDGEPIDEQFCRLTRNGDAYDVTHWAPGEVTCGQVRSHIDAETGETWWNPYRVNGKRVPRWWGAGKTTPNGAALALLEYLSDVDSCQVCNPSCRDHDGDCHGRP